MSSTPPVDLRAAQARRTRAAIRAAAFELTRDRGYCAMTVDDVASLAGVSRRTVFNHFPTKADLVIVGAGAPGPEAVEAFVSGTGPLLEDLRTMLVTGASAMEAERRDFRAVRELIRDNPELKVAVHAKVREFSLRMTDASARRLGAAPEDPRVHALVALASSIQRAAVDIWAGDATRTGEAETGTGQPGLAQPAAPLQAPPGDPTGAGTPHDLALGQAPSEPGLPEAISTVITALEDILGPQKPLTKDLA